MQMQGLFSYSQKLYQQTATQLAAKVRLSRFIQEYKRKKVFWIYMAIYLAKFQVYSFIYEFLSFTWVDKYNNKCSSRFKIRTPSLKYPY